MMPELILLVVLLILLFAVHLVIACSRPQKNLLAVLYGRELTPEAATKNRLICLVNLIIDINKKHSSGKRLICYLSFTCFINLSRTVIRNILYILSQSEVFYIFDFFLLLCCFFVSAES